MNKLKTILVGVDFSECSRSTLEQAVRLARMASKRELPIGAWRSSQFPAEVGWREFARHLLYHFPHTPAEPLRAEFKKFPWRKDAAWLKAWQKGRTGYPIVDAGMHELWATGWMHNRLRMIVASSLVKEPLDCGGGVA